jgi:hypothetical protein
MHIEIDNIYSELFDKWRICLQQFYGVLPVVKEENAEHCLCEFKKNVFYDFNIKEYKTFASFFTSEELLFFYQIRILDVDHEMDFIFSVNEIKIVIQCMFRYETKVYFLLPTFFTKELEFNHFSKYYQKKHPELTEKTREIISKIIKILKNHPVYRLELLLHYQIESDF